MDVTINYGAEKLILNLPDSVTVDEYQCGNAMTAIDFGGFISSIIKAEQKQFPIAETDLFIVNDAYRPTPTSKVLGWLDKSERINRHANFLIATGCHQAPDEDQLNKIFGGLYQKLRKRIIVHDAKNIDNMIEIGVHDSDQPIYINRYLYKARKVLVIGSVEPHYFAGFTGGRKSIFPGLCDFETTSRNHNLAVSFRAQPMKLEGNPVEENLRSLMMMLPEKPIVSIQIVMGRSNDMQAVFCGDINSSFHQAVELSKSIFGAQVESKYDLVLAEVRPPLDSNLYQLQKSLENTQTAVSDKGVITLFSPCREGIGSDSFYNLADHWESDNSVNDNRNNFGVHKLARVEKIGKRINVGLYSELPDGVPDKVYFNTIRNPQSLINKLIEKKKNIRTALVRDAGHTVLTMN